MAKCRDIVAFSWLTPLIKRMRGLTEVTTLDVGSPEADFAPGANGRLILAQWNRKLKMAQGKRLPMFLGAIMAAYSKWFLVLLVTAQC